MTIKELYRYERSEGKFTVSPFAPENKEYTIIYRLIADEGKVLKNGTRKYECIDVESPEGFSEVEA